MTDYFNKKTKNLVEKFDEEKKNDLINGQKINKETTTKEELCFRKIAMMKYPRSVSCNQLINSVTTQASLFTSPEVQYKVIDLVSPPNNSEKKIKSHLFSTSERRTAGRQLTLDYKKNENDEILKAKVNICLFLSYKNDLSGIKKRIV